MNKDSRAYTVSQVNRYIANMFSSDFALKNITIQGEISNLKYHPTGHIYFTLKDAASQISGIMFAGDRAGLPFKLENGMRVLCTGSVGVYERGGSYQIYAKRFIADGIGDLYVRFEQLKKELEEMGLFDPMYKKPIPKYAQRIGVVTAKTGAAVRDIVQISKRRNPYVEIVLYPALVQGEDAVPSIVHGIRTLDQLGLDVLIVGRGGGSIEDLWAFNEEPVARAIFEADTPIISAVGHETDTTIADYVADLRAPTPSAGAELAVFDYQKLMEELGSYRATLDSVMNERIQDERQRLAMQKLRLNQLSPGSILKEYQKRSLQYETQLRDAMREKLQDAKDRARSFDDLRAEMQTHIQQAKDRLVGYSGLRESMLQRLHDAKEQLHRYDGMPMLMTQTLDRARHGLALRTEKLEAVSPLRKLSSGYGYVQDAEGHRVDSVGKLAVGDLITTQLRDGSFRSRVEQISTTK